MGPSQAESRLRPGLGVCARQPREGAGAKIAEGCRVARSAAQGPIVLTVTAALCHLPQAHVQPGGAEARSLTRAEAISVAIIHRQEWVGGCTVATQLLTFPARLCNTCITKQTGVLPGLARGH